MTDLLAVGLVTLLGQAVLLRELNVAFYGTELIYILGLGVWLVWTAAGVLLGPKETAANRSRIRLLFLLFAFFLPLDAVFIRLIRTLFTEARGAFLPFGHQVSLLSLSLLPVGILSGSLFREACGLWIRRGGSFPRAYAWESLGGLIGGIAATLFLQFGLRNLSILLLCSLAALGAAWAGREGGSRRFRIAALLTAVPLLPGVLYSGRLDLFLTRFNHPDLLASMDTPYSRITLTRRGGQVALFENDQLCHETEGTEAEEFVHPAALLHPHPERVLILGGGWAGLVEEMRKHSPARVDYVELNRDLLDAAALWLPAEKQQALRDETVRTHIGDPRRFLRLADRFDLILIGMPEPSSGQANRFYTRDFFQLCADRLRPAGILAFRLRTAENYWTDPETLRAAGIFRALREVLPEVQVLPGAANLFAASGAPLPRDPALLASRLESRAIQTRLVSPPFLRYLYENDRYREIRQRLEARPAPVNTDIRPACYRYTMLLWLSRFFPEVSTADFPSFPPSGGQGDWRMWIAAAVLGTAFLTARRFRRLPRCLLAGSAAFMGMVLESALVLYYQVKAGILYQDIGLLLTGFLAGLCLGALRRMPQDGRRSFLLSGWYGLLLCLCFAALSLLLALVMNEGTVQGLAPVVVLLGLTGYLVSAALSHASAAAREKRPGSAAAALYASDLAGGCLGSLAATLLLIPSAGLVETCLWMAPLALLAALLIRI